MLEELVFASVQRNRLGHSREIMSGGSINLGNRPGVSGHGH